MACLKDKVGIVTGGGTGIGRATALAMARAGAALVIGNRDAAKGEEVVTHIRQAGGTRRVPENRREQARRRDGAG